MASKSLSGQVGNGAFASDASPSENNADLSAMVAQVMQRVLNPAGHLPSGGVSRELLRDQPEREKALMEFVAAMMPTAVNPDLWMAWLNGGESPFAGAKLAHPDPDGQSISRAADRQMKRVRKSSEKLAAARKAAEVANRNLATAEKIAAVEMSFDAGLVQYAVSDHLLKLLSSIFAMGPAWTLMRAASSHVDMVALEQEMILIKKPEQREAFVERRIAERKASSLELLQSLDYWCGDADYEAEIHDALKQVVKRYEGIERKDGRVRGPGAYAKSVSNVRAKRDAAQVLAGLSTGKP